MSLCLTGICKSFHTSGSRVVLDDVSLEVQDGRMTVIVGPSGSGKTTLLRCVAGLEDVDRGRIEVGGRDVTSAGPGERDVAMVFQDYALYPHLSVRENIAFGLRARKVPRDQIDKQVAEAAAAVGLESSLGAAPNHLSGGERQRVALARALVRRPAAFLLDEPLSNLDAELRTQTRREIRALQQSLQTTTLYVTHDQVEAMTMGDTVAVLRAGRLEQVGGPGDLYERPANVFVARFLGSPPMNLFPADVLGSSRGVTAGVRPERIALVEPTTGRLEGVVDIVEPIGGEAIVHVIAAGSRFLVRSDVRTAPRPGDSVGLGFADTDVHAFDADDRRLG